MAPLVLDSAVLGDRLTTVLDCGMYVVGEFIIQYNLYIDGKKLERVANGRDGTSKMFLKER